jgi:uncharacterized membrane protein YgcG
LAARGAAPGGGLARPHLRESGPMLRHFDLGSWESVLTTLVGLALVTLIGVGLRLLAMLTIQQRRERRNRQINERLRALIAAYKTLGGSFTGDLSVDPRHRRDLSRRGAEGDDALDLAGAEGGSDRARRIRDAVEAALSDIILLGTQRQVRLAATAARELAEGRPVHTQELVAALRAYIRETLDLDAIPDDVTLPAQGPARPSSTGGRGGGRDGAGREGGRGGGAGSGGGMGAGGVGLGAGGLGLGLGARLGAEDDAGG